LRIGEIPLRAGCAAAKARLSCRNLALAIPAGVSEGIHFMQIDGKTVRHIARLARLKIDAKQAKSLEKELTSILGWVEQLNKIDTSDVQPMTGAADMKMTLRADVMNDGGYPELIVKNAPLTEDHFFVVPKVVE
jgi:aspartyl-tRNA(Asn)/glutamyl-tRNA(Gln) amidotransferase subunit C